MSSGAPLLQGTRLGCATSCAQGRLFVRCSPCAFIFLRIFTTGFNVIEFRVARNQQPRLYASCCRSFLFVFFCLIESALTLFWERAANHAPVYTTVFCRCRSESEPVCRQFAFRLNVIYGFKNGCDGSATGSVSSAKSRPTLCATLSQQTSISSAFTKRTDRHIWDTPRTRR